MNDHADSHEVTEWPDIEPASDLPWQRSNRLEVHHVEDVYDIVTADGSDVADFVNDQDADYLVTACNAYPEMCSLIEQLSIALEERCKALDKMEKVFSKLWALSNVWMHVDDEAANLLGEELYKRLLDIMREDENEVSSD